MSAPRTMPQSKEALLKSYTTRLKDDVKSMLENFEGKFPEFNLTFPKVEHMKCFVKMK